MTRLQPFRGWRYDLAAANASSLDELLVPPYDIISPAEQAAFYDRHPHNVIRAVLAQARAGDGDGHNCYTRAAASMAGWKDQGILRPERMPAIYLLQERFSLPGGGTALRTGLIARLRLASWGHGILPHERTFPGAKADRLALTMATRSQFSPILTLYTDPEDRVLSPLRSVQRLDADALFRDDRGTECRLWAISEPQAVQATAAALEPLTLYVADGHHRWETALNYQRFRRGKGLADAAPPEPLSTWRAAPGYRDYQAPGPQALQPYDHALVYAAPMEDPGVVIWPTHRCLHNLDRFSAPRLLDGLQALFEVTPMGDDALLWALHQAAPGEHTFGLVLSSHAAQDVVGSSNATDEPVSGYLLRLRSDEQAGKLLEQADHPTVAAIDVAALQTLVLGPLLGIDREPAAQKRVMVGQPDARIVLSDVRQGRFQAAFLVNATTLDQLRAVAHAGQVMPAKATYFYPKLPSGLVINTVDLA